MTNEEMIQKYYGGDDSMLENCTMKTSVLYTALQKKLPLHSIASIKRKQTAGAYGLYKRNIK